MPELYLDGFIFAEVLSCWAQLDGRAWLLWHIALLGFRSLRHDASARESGTWPGAIRICPTNDFYAAISAQHTIALHTVLQRP